MRSALRAAREKQAGSLHPLVAGTNEQTDTGASDIHPIRVQGFPQWTAGDGRQRGTEGGQRGEGTELAAYRLTI